MINDVVGTLGDEEQVGLEALLQQSTEDTWMI